MLRRFWSVVPAAGVGKRMGGALPKQYLEVLGKTVLEHTLDRLLAIPKIQGIAVAVGEEDEYWNSLSVSSNPRILRAPGGQERADSVYHGLTQLRDLADSDDWVLVHDAARLCITREDIEKLMDLEPDPVGGILALPVSDTLKTVKEGLVLATPDRSSTWRALTPQMFRYGLLKTALEKAMEDGIKVTDEASAIEHLGYQPRVIPGRSDNIKVTHPEDLALAQFYLERQC